MRQRHFSFGAVNTHRLFKNFEHASDADSGDDVVLRNFRKLGNRLKQCAEITIEQDQKTNLIVAFHNPVRNEGDNAILEKLGIGSTGISACLEPKNTS